MSLSLDSLNPRQREAVLHNSGPMLVLAGAGSGKTRVIMYRMARLIEDGVAPERILGVTFTNKAAKEMRERLRTLVGRGSSKVVLSTFHALGLMILKQEYKAAGLGARFSIYDTSDQLSLVRELMRKVQVADRRLDANKVKDIILAAKRARQTEVFLDSCDDYEFAAHELYPRYIEQMKAFDAIDFDDLLLRSEDVLEVPDVKERWAARYDYIMVDEYQDTSPEQLALIRVLASAHNNVCVVGDDDQSIYGWRGAKAGNILSFSRDFKGAKEVVLDQNYRSTGNILVAANRVIEQNEVRKKKELWSAGGAGDQVEIVACSDGEGEAEFVCEQIAGLRNNNVPAENIAVLYRSNKQSLLFEEYLGLAHLPFRVVGGQAFFDRKEVRDLVAYLSMLHNPRDEVSLRRIINVPTRGIGTTSVERLSRFVEEKKIGLWGGLRAANEVEGLSKPAINGISTLLTVVQECRKQLEESPAEELVGIISSLIERLNLRDVVLASNDSASVREQRLGNLDSVIHSLNRFYERTSGEAASAQDVLANYLNSSALFSNKDEEAATGEITLMTLHSAKGLEFPYVFLVGVEDNILPHQRSIELGESLDEERRLCYVGITRAKIALWMTWARTRNRYGNMEARARSRFLDCLQDCDAVLERGAASMQVSEEDNDKMADDFFAKMRASFSA